MNLSKPELQAIVEAVDGSKAVAEARRPGTAHFQIAFTHDPSDMESMAYLYDYAASQGYRVVNVWTSLEVERGKIFREVMLCHKHPSSYWDGTI